jgi:hypothetical protein
MIRDKLMNRMISDEWDEIRSEGLVRFDTCIFHLAVFEVALFRLRP